MASSARPCLKTVFFTLTAALTFLVGPLPLAHSRIVDASGYIAPEALKICQLVADAHRVPFHAQSEHYSSLDVAHTFAEAALRRPPGTARLDAAANAHYQQLLAPLSTQQRHDITNLLQALASHNNAASVGGCYDYIFIHSSTVPGLRQGLANLSTQVLEKKFDLGPGTQVIFFDGERPPFAKETLEVLLNPSPYLPEPSFTPATVDLSDERQKSELVYRQLWLPSALRAAPVSFVHAPIETGAHQVLTEDVVRRWARTDRPHAGRALMVSSQPYLESQRLATMLALWESHGPAIEVVALEPGPECEEGLGAAALGPRLDNLAESLALALKLRTLADANIQSALVP